MTAAAQLARTAALTIAWMIVLPCFVLLFSAIVPIIPWVRIYAFDIVPNQAPWLAVLSLAALIIGMATHARHRMWTTRALIVVASIAMLAAAGVMVHLLYVAGSNGVRINLFKTLSLRTYSENAWPDESRIYARPQGEPLWLDIYRPKPAMPRRPSPVLIVVHGGGFVGGSRRTGAANMRGYARSGWTVISIDYRLARPGRPTWDLALGDVRCALAWTAAHAAALGIDLDRLTLSGASAGGSLAIAAAYTADGAPQTACGAHVPRVAAVVAKAPLVDPIGSWNHAGELRNLQRSCLTRYLGGTPEEYPERYAAIDLRRHLRAGDPPTLILAGADDPILPAAGVEDLARRAAQTGSPVRLIQFPYSGHDFNTAFHGIANQSVRQIVEHFMVDHGVGPVGPPA